MLHFNGPWNLPLPSPGHMPPFPETPTNGSCPHHPLQHTDACSASLSLSFLLFCLFQGLVVKRLTEGESRGQPVGSGGSSSEEIDWLAAWAHFNIWKWPEASAINQHSTLCHFCSSASFSCFPLLLTEASLLAFYPAASLPTSNTHPLQILPHPCQTPLFLFSALFPTPHPLPVIGDIRSTVLFFPFNIFFFP